MSAELGITPGKVLESTELNATTVDLQEDVTSDALLRWLFIVLGIFFIVIAILGVKYFRTTKIKPSLSDYRYVAKSDDREPFIDDDDEEEIELFAAKGSHNYS